MTKTTRAGLSLTAAVLLSALLVLQAQPPAPNVKGGKQPPKQKEKLDPKGRGAKQPEPVRVLLTLVNTLTTRPLSEVEVIVPRLATTNGAGVVEFSLTPGNQRVEVAGYAQQIISVEPGEPLQLTVPMTPMGSIRGKIRNTSGEPLGDMMVTALEMSWKGPQRTMAANTVITGKNGEFLLEKVTGRALVRISERNGRQERRLENRYYPGGETLSQAVPIDVTPGGIVELPEFYLNQRDAYEIRGKVSGAAQGNVSLLSLAYSYRGIPLPQNRARWDGSPPEMAAIEQDGTFVFPGVLPGVYRLIHAQGVSYAEEVVTVTDRDVEEVFLQPSSVRDIDGIITLEAEVGLKLPEAIRLYPLHEPAPVLKADLGGRSTFRLSGVLPVEYIVEAIAPPGYILTLVTGRHDFTPGTIDPRDIRDPLLVRLNLTRAKLTGKLRAEPGKVFAGVWVTIAPEHPYRDRLDLYQSVRTNKDGEFVFANVAPMVYRVFAWENIDLVLRHSPDFLDLFQGTPAVLTNQWETNVETPIIPSLEIERAKFNF